MRNLRARLNPSLLVGVLLVSLVVGAALLSFVWVPYPPDLVVPEDRLAGMFSDGHLLGTDKLGRDTLSQILVGARTTLLVGIVAVGVAAVVGVPLGLLAAMTWPWLGNLIMRASDLVLAFPALLLAIMLAAVYGGSVVTAMVAIGIATVPAFARVVRSGALTVLTQDYVLAARVAGRGKLAIALRHVLPNVTSLIIVQASVAFAIAILAEAALSFLGLGAPPDVPSWGRMLQESQSMLSQAPRLALIPGAAIAVAVLGFNLLGDGLRDLLDPRLAKTSEEAR
ncbi:ABC transporter permease [Demetria terragena]|uniref:ABC transporter permease n=1 Tax=Demetria terragena TaxID=63959 RepID=UPI00036677D1|nr:ABC transporter permease [Demetria terragena]